MDYYSKYLKYKRKYLQLKMELASNNLNVDDTAVIKGGSNNIFIPSEANLGLPDVLPDTLNSSDHLSEFDNYLKGGAEEEVDEEIEYGGDSCGSKDENHMIGGDNYKTPTDTPLTIVELNDTEETPKYTPETTTELSMEGGNKNTMTSPSSSEIFQSISKTE
jgi:hypothetical protein